jgi:diguanylate cyclase
VTGILNEHERTLAFAEVALGQIKSMRQLAIPRNYEVWYVYASGQNASLNKVVNETLAIHGKLTEADLDQIYETYLSQIRTTERIDKVGARLISEIAEVMNLITDALGMTSSFGDSLAGASKHCRSRMTAIRSGMWSNRWLNPPAKFSLAIRCCDWWDSR